MEQHQKPQYYTVMIPKQDPDPDPDRLAKLLELGDPDFFACSLLQASYFIDDGLLKIIIFHQI
jgi:hypothetical protein